MSKLDEAKEILESLGLPAAQQNDRSAYTLLALLDLKEDDEWSRANNYLTGIHGIIGFIAENYGLQYAENSRESIRRQTIHQFEQAGIIQRNADDPTRPTNSGKTVYSVTDEALYLIKNYNTDEWEDNLEDFLGERETLAARYADRRNRHRVPIHFGDANLRLSAGDHNVLQKLMIEEFAAIFAQGSQLLYVGDTAKKHLYSKNYELEELGIPITLHDKLPDVVLYDTDRNWLFLMEAVTSHGPVSPKRLVELEEMLEDCECGKIYVSCFLDKATFKKYSDDIAWDTEVWIASDPEHMIHWNGDRFMGPR